MATHTNTLLGVPLFSVDTVTQGPADGETGIERGSVLVAGGGGSSRSGIANVVSVLSVELNRDGDARANTKMKYTTGDELSMVLSASPNGKYVACSVSEGTLLLEHSPEEGGLTKAAQFRTDFPPPPADPTEEPKQGCQNTVRFSPDSTHFATGGEDSVIRIWSVDSFGPLRPKPAPENPPPEENKGNEVSASAEESEGKSADEPKVHDPRRWARRDVTKVRELKGHRGEIKDLSYHPSGQLLASVSSDHTCLIWSTVNGSKRQVLPSDSSRGLTYRGCRFVSETTLLTLQVPRVRGGDSYIVVWGITGAYSPVAKWELKKVCVVAPKGVATSIAASPCGRAATVGGADGSILMVNTATWKVMRRIPEVQGLPVTAVGFTNCIKGRVEPKVVEGDKERKAMVAKYGELYVVSVSMDKLISMVPVAPRKKKRGWCYIFTMLFLGMLLLSAAAFVFALDPAMKKSITKKWQKTMEADNLSDMLGMLMGSKKRPAHYQYHETLSDSLDVPEAEVPKVEEDQETKESSLSDETNAGEGDAAVEEEEEVVEVKKESIIERVRPSRFVEEEDEEDPYEEYGPPVTQQQEIPSEQISSTDWAKDRGFEEEEEEDIYEDNYAEAEEEDVQEDDYDEDAADV